MVNLDAKYRLNFFSLINLDFFIFWKHLVPEILTPNNTNQGRKATSTTKTNNCQAKLKNDSSENKLINPGDKPMID